MNITRNVFTILDLSNWMNEKHLVVNKEYQRGKGLWPTNARSFFIDTILNGFPFPKVIIWQKIDMQTRRAIREIIDGQQRLTTINDFINGKFKLTSVSQNYKGKFFSDLEDEAQSLLLAYEVSVDTIVGSTKEEVLEVFRRMNSYTLPLNNSEKRHATYQGAFKWFVSGVTKEYTSIFEDYKILKSRNISRMEDAELIAELCIVLENGLGTKSQPEIEKFYKIYDDSVNERMEAQLLETLEYMKNELHPILESELLISSTFHSIFAALAYNKWGNQLIKLTADIGNTLQSERVFTHDLNLAIENIFELLGSLDEGADNIRSESFVKACRESTNNKHNRLTRTKWFIAALQNKRTID